MNKLASPLGRLACLVLLCGATLVSASPLEPLRAAAQREKPLLLETLRQLVGIESGSREVQGLEQAAKLIADRLRSLGGKVELVDTNTDVYRMEDTPEKIGKAVRATFTGTGTARILLIAHMDTVYPGGMLARQPFEIRDDKAYGLGIADDKGGVAVILHTVAMLKSLNYDKFGQLTVLINGDEEISSPGSRALITRLGGEHDVVMSFEGSSIRNDGLSLATAGIASVNLTVKGRASHAGSSPELGVNALYELSHQLLQMRDLSDPAHGVKVNWTMANAGITRNMIPPFATAAADVRVLRVADYDGVEKKLRERIQNKLLPASQVELVFERRRPPLESTAASKAFAAHAQTIYNELGLKLNVDATAGGGGTDAAFASLATKAAVVERFGLQGFGAHTTDAEFVLIGSIEPRLYLAARMVMEAAEGKWRK
nr:glutamate carboxypeptidase [uncultured Roseateles sp.]